MQKLAVKKLYRIVDANFNRAKEGLRVCEDVCRFVYNKKAATKRYKDIRHRLTRIIETLKITTIIDARDVDGDVGRGSGKAELKRKNVKDVFYANSQRVKESLRVLEEITKIVNSRSASAIKRIRYQIYVLEKEVIKKF